MNTVQEEREPARAEGCVLWIYGQAWEDRSALDGLHPPTPFDDWVAFLRGKGWTVGWTALGAIAEGPNRGGAVVEVDVGGERAYVAVPPELLGRLQAVMDAHEYRMVGEDVAALDNPQALGLRVTRLNPVAWEQRHEVVPTKELRAEAWAQAIRDNHLRVAMPAGAILPLDGAWPAGQVVTVSDGAGHRYYFAVPRQALRLAMDLYLETKSAAPISPSSAVDF